MSIRKSEGTYSVIEMQKLATCAATADGLEISGNNFKVGALIGCPDKVLYCCELIEEQNALIAEFKKLLDMDGGAAIDRLIELVEGIE